MSTNHSGQSLPDREFLHLQTDEMAEEQEKLEIGKDGTDKQNHQIVEEGGQIVLSPEEERRIHKKIDCVILPVVSAYIIYFP